MRRTCGAGSPRAASGAEGARPGLPFPGWIKTKQNFGYDINAKIMSSKPNFSK